MTDERPTPDAPRLPGPADRRPGGGGSTALRRWGPLGAIVVVVALVAGLTLTSGDDESSEEAGGGGDSSSTTLDPDVVAKLPITYPEAEEAGTVDDYDWGERCDPETGRIRIPTVFAPPCVPVFEGDNGGDVGPGVSADTIKLVNYIPAPDGDLTALLAGVQDPQDVQTESEQDYLAMFSALYETYGREVELVDFQATGADEVAARADAVAVAEEIQPFASIGGPGLTQAYAEELAARGVMCIGCGVSAPDSMHQELAPYMWGSSATPEQYLVNLGDYITNRLMGSPAEFGGDDVADQERVFGVVHFEQDPPVFGGVNETVAERGAERGYSTELTETYTLDFPKLPERAATIIAKMKDAGVTSIIFLGDPIMPIYLTQAASEQDYYPEWIVTGTVLTTTSVFGRQYDQDQWAHAFGISPLAARIPNELGDSWRLHEWWYGRPPTAAKTHAVIYPSLAQVMTGIQMAGPELTAETFRAGMFNLPASGGGPTTPQVSYGSVAGFENPDYLGVDDVTEVWWDVTTEEADEQGVVGTGVYRYSDGGRRFLPGEMPSEPPRAFVEEGSIVVYDEVPPEDQWPDYPAPPDAPSQQ